VICTLRISSRITGEKILKIGPDLPKLLSNIKQLTFWEHGVVKYVFRLRTVG